MSHEEEIRHLTSIFYALRGRGFELGIGELLAALDALGKGWGGDGDRLLRLTRLLWCHSVEQRMELKNVWSGVAAGGPRLVPSTSKKPAAKTEPTQPVAVPVTDAAQPAGSEYAPIPIKAPPPAAPMSGGVSLRAYWPLSRRAMAYGWRHLRRLAADGPEDVLDVDATVARAARECFFLQPAYRRRLRNRARLVLMLDQYGSMEPFHPFCRDLAETARGDDSLEDVSVGYFHNVPDFLFRDPHLTEPWDPFPLAGESCVLVVSDAGAARGYHSSPRIEMTEEFLKDWRRETRAIAWLNPMPANRWSRTTAQALAQRLPMHQMDEEGFRAAISVLRGI